MVFQSISYFVPRRDEIGWNGIEMMDVGPKQREEKEKKKAQNYFFLKKFSKVLEPVSIQKWDP